MKEKLIFEEKFPLKHFTTVKACGDMKDAANRGFLLRSSGLDPANLVLARQIHGNDVRVAGEFDKGSIIENCDGLITNARNIMLGIFTADCMPVLMVSKDKSVKAAVHAGRKGLAAGILQNTLKLFQEKFGIEAENIAAYIGPHIGECCYEVGGDIAKMFAVPLENNMLDLSEIAVKILKGKGVKEIYESALCSCCRQDLFFSYRKDKTEKRMITVV